MSGRLTVHQGERQYHIGIDWRHDPLRDEILLVTPLGQGVAEIVRAADGARLQLADRREMLAPDWNQLAEQVFGFALPLDAIVHWVSGKGAGVDGWRVGVPERQGDLPILLELEREDIHVRLKVDEWVEVR